MKKDDSMKNDQMKPKTSSGIEARASESAPFVLY
jgi:hypothetical protein